MSQSARKHVNESEKPTHEEVYRDFLIFWMNHREEKLFRYEIFTDIVAKEYTIPRKCFTEMKDVEHVVLAHPLMHFVNVLRLCYDQLHHRMGKLDLLSVLNYAKEAL